MRGKRRTPQQVQHVNATDQAGRPLRQQLVPVDLAADTTGTLPADRLAGYYEPITNGDPGLPELVFAGGDVVMAFVTLP